MRSLAARGLLAGIVVFAAASPSLALIDADSPDDICAPAADPCVVSDRVRVTAPGNLDFGLRTVHVTGEGRFEQTTAISCGAFVVDVGDAEIAADSSNGGGDAGSFSVTARRACSGDGVTPCLDDTVCTGGGLGTCSVGDGTIDVAGQFQSTGGPGGSLVFRAAGDIDADGLLVVNSTITGEVGGSLEVESFTGSVRIDAAVKGNSGSAGEYGEPEEAGSVTVRAAVDVTIAGPIELNGGQYAGYLEIASGRDVHIEADITSNGGGLLYADGGYAEITAARHITMTSPGSGVTRMQLNAGSRLDQDYGAPYPGNGGNASLYAGGDIDIDRLSIIESKTPLGSCDANPYGGEIYLVADGQTRVYGDIFSAGKGSCGVGGTIRLEAGDRVVIGEQSEVDTVARFGGEVLVSSDGTIDVDGKINVRGSPPGYLYYLYGQSGYATVSGQADVTVSGSVLSGSGDGFGDGVTFDVCRLHVLDGAKIDDTFGGPEGGGSNVFRIGESMIADAGSQLSANPIVDGVNRIRYRDPDKPPVLLGSVSPAADLIVDPSIPGCPVCGNSEIDQGESCDDGNVASGDGCRNDCQDEGCLAETPGFPGTALCDDADACTADDCDPVNHVCIHDASCDEGIECTIDECVAGACQHVADSPSCDDLNECTVDTCSLASGCTYTNQTGGNCEDGDLCTQTGTCSAGKCVASDPVRTIDNRLKLRFEEGSEDDRLGFRARMPLAGFAANPALTGLVLRMQDALDQSILDATIPASAFEDQGSGRYRFRDSGGSVAGAAGIRAVGVRVVTAKSVARVNVKGADMELAAAEGQAAVTLSLLWGTDAAVDDCLTARRLTCTAKATSLACRDE